MDEFGRAPHAIGDCGRLMGCHSCLPCGDVDDVLTRTDRPVRSILGEPYGRYWT